MIELSFFAIISAFSLCIINSARKTLLLWLSPLRWYDCQLNLLCSISGSQHLKMDAWNTIVSFWVYSLFSGAIPARFFSGGGCQHSNCPTSEMFHNICPNKLSNFQKISHEHRIPWNFQIPEVLKIQENFPTKTSFEGPSFPPLKTWRWSAGSGHGTWFRWCKKPLLCAVGQDQRDQWKKVRS